MHITLAKPGEFFDRAGELMRANWDETGFGYPFAPDRDAFIRLAESGCWFALVAQDEVGGVLGYSSAVLGLNPWNPAYPTCLSDALYVLPQARRTLAGWALIQETEAEAKRRGATRMLWHTRHGTVLAAALERAGYTPADEVVMKEL